MSRPVCILVCALGGEGGGVLAEWLYQLAVRGGYPAQSTSVPGVAQRTGATTYYVEIGTQPEGAAPRPVFSLNPVPGNIDLLVSSELLETARQVGNAMASAERTTIISSTSRSLTVAEKMQLGDGRVDEARLLAVLQRHARALDLMDMPALAAAAGTQISAVLLGAIAASGLLPFKRDAFEAVIAAGDRGVEASLRGFALAFEQLSQRKAQQAAVLEALAPTLAPDLRALAIQRLTAYQDADYAALYTQRLARIEAAAGPGDTVNEVTRWLALWMMFDDIVRVAGLKAAATRAARVRREVAARDDEIVKTFEHFKPGVPELAGLLPAAWANKLLAWDARRVAAGHDAWALPLKIGTHSVTGLLALRLVAALKGWRRRGSRFVAEQQLIERWLTAVERGAREHPALGHELALGGALVKGYGSTNDRGKEKLLHLIEHLAFGSTPVDDRVAAVRAARLAATADDGGLAFDAALKAHGAPPRAPRAQVIRWYKRRPDGHPQGHSVP